MATKKDDDSRSLVAEVYEQFGGRPFHGSKGALLTEDDGEQAGARIYELTLKDRFPTKVDGSS